MLLIFSTQGCDCNLMSLFRKQQVTQVFLLLATAVFDMEQAK